ncbi:MAG: bile acid:sodium symporter family protein [Halioglobus sp.]
MGEFYIRYEFWLAAVQLALAMFGMGATLTFDDFKDVLREPKAVLLGTGLQLLLVPLAAYAFIHGSGVIGGVAVGIALVAAIPGGTTSNIFTHMSRGNSPLSISITGITTLACLVTTPLILSALIAEYLPSTFTMPVAQVFRDIALILLLPLSLGMLYLKRNPDKAPTVSKWSIRASLFTIVLIIVGSSSAGRLDTEAFGATNAWLVFGFTIVLLVLGRFVPWVLRLPTRDCVAIEMEAVVRNTNLGVLIKASMFPIVVGGDNQMGDMVLFTVLLYGGLQMLFAALLIFYNRRIIPAPAGS